MRELRVMRFWLVTLGIAACACSNGGGSGAPAGAAGPDSVNGLAPSACKSANDCDDGDPCTTDSCSDEGTCTSLAPAFCGGDGGRAVASVPCKTDSDCAAYPHPGAPCILGECNAAEGRCAWSVAPGGFAWLDLVATAADTNGLPSVFAEQDSRAGSLQVLFNGTVGMNGVTTDPPRRAAIVTLRNGVGWIVEQWHLDRLLQPFNLDEYGCHLDARSPRCWIQFPEDGVGEVLGAALPVHSAGSNTWFDPVTPRIEVRGEARVDHSFAPFEDSSHESVVFEWHAPLGLSTAQLLLRARVDGHGDGLGASDPFVVLLRRNFPQPGSEVFDARAVQVLFEDEHTLAVRVGAQVALEAICAP